MDKVAKKYVICGHYGVTNLGDEAIGIGLIEAVKLANLDHKITVMSYDKHRSYAFYKKYLPEFSVKTVYLVPLGIRSLFRGIFAGELKNTKNSIKSCDRFILGGGGLFTDERLYAVFLWGLQALYAIRYKKPLFLIGHSVGPVNSRIGKWIVKSIFNKAEFISVRDNESKKVLRKLGVKKEIHILCDMAMLMNFDKKNVRKSLNKKIVQNDDKKYFILTFRSWDEKLDKLNKKIVQELRRLTEKYNLIPVLIPFQLIKENDQENMNKKIVQNGNLKKIVIQKYQDNIFEIFRQIKGAEFVIGVRLHSLVFASMMGTPFVGISYSKKVENFMEEMNMRKYCLTNDRFDENELDEIIEKMINDSGFITETIGDEVQMKVKYAKNMLKKVLN